MFASDLGWVAGYWPRTFWHGGERWIRGAREVDSDGDLRWYEYLQEQDPKESMKVFND